MNLLSFFLANKRSPDDLSSHGIEPLSAVFADFEIHVLSAVSNVLKVVVVEVAAIEPLDLERFEAFDDASEPDEQSSVT